MNREQAYRLWREYANPDFVELLEFLDFGRCFVTESASQRRLA